MCERTNIRNCACKSMDDGKPGDDVTNVISRVNTSSTKYAQMTYCSWNGEHNSTRSFDINTLPHKNISRTQFELLVNELLLFVFRFLFALWLRTF